MAMGRVGVRTCCRVGGEKQQHEENRTEQLVAAISVSPQFAVSSSKVEFPSVDRRFLQHVAQGGEGLLCNDMWRKWSDCVAVEHGRQHSFRLLSKNLFFC